MRSHDICSEVPSTRNCAFLFGEAGTLFLILSSSSYLLLAGAIKELADRRGHPYKRIGSAISS